MFIALQWRWKLDFWGFSVDFFVVVSLLAEIWSGTLRLLFFKTIPCSWENQGKYYDPASASS